ADAPAPGSTAAAAALEILGPDGAVHKLLVRESPILSSELQARMPEVRTYALTGAGDPSLTGRFDLTPVGRRSTTAFSCRVTSNMSAQAQPATDFTFPVVFTRLQTLRLARRRSTRLPFASSCPSIAATAFRTSSRAAFPTTVRL